jgi:acyl dehydratase
MKQYERYRAFDDFAVGEVIHSLGRTVNEADVVLFTGLAGIKAPLFIDAEYCKTQSRYGRRIVPGLLTASLGAGMMEDILGPYVVAALEIDALRFHLPVFPGDTLRAAIHVMETHPTSDGKHGVLSVRTVMANQDERDVFELRAKFLMKRDS